MKTTLIALSLFAALPAGAAFADDDGCSVSRAEWQKQDAIFRLAEENGWTIREIEIDDGCYEIEGHDRDGRRIEVEIHPATLQVMELDYEDDDDGGTARNPAPAGTVAPPQNGLFGNGAPPQVQQN